MYKVTSYYQEDQVAIAKFLQDSRYLFSDYHYYLRNALLSILNGTADIAKLTTRLHENKASIVGLLAPYYSAESCNALSDSLAAHATIALEYIKATATKQPLTAIQEQWVANVDEIATLLNSIDPIRWQKAAVVAFWTQDANCMHRQATSRVAGDWASDIVSSDLAYKNIIELADCIGNGIVMSNLEKFSK